MQILTQGSDGRPMPRLAVLVHALTSVSSATFSSTSVCFVANCAWKCTAHSHALLHCRQLLCRAWCLIDFTELNIGHCDCPEAHCSQHVPVMMVHEERVCNVPVSKVLNDILHRGFHVSLHASWTMFNHAQNEQLVGHSCVRSTNLEQMQIPTVNPLLHVLVKGVPEEMVNKPDVCQGPGVEAVAPFQIKEEKFPLAFKTLCDVKPKAFDMCIMSATT